MLEKQRIQETQLQSYLSDMGDMLLEKGDKMQEGGPFLGENALVRAKTLATLHDVDPSRKSVIVQYLYDTSLVYIDDVRTELACPVSELPSTPDPESPDEYLSNQSPVNLRGADLKKVDLTYRNLIGVDLSDTYMSEVKMYQADLGNADIHYSGLSKADLRNTNLSCANLSESNLSGADLTDTEMSDVDLTNADLSDVVGADNDALEDAAASLKGATMPDGSIHD